MVGVLEDWLLECVGVNVNLSVDSVGEACYDGMLFSDIFVAYNVCSVDYTKLIKTVHNEEGALLNLKKLCVWFKLLGIPFSESIMKRIASKDDVFCLKILYELFVRLDSRETILYMNTKNKDRIFSQSTDKFLVQPAPPIEHIPEPYNEKQYLYDILKETKDYIVNSDRALISKHLRMGMKLRADLVKNELKKEKKIILPGSFPESLTYLDDDVKTKIKKFEESLETPERLDRQALLDCSPKTYTTLLKLKSRKTEVDKKLKGKLESLVMEDALRKISQDHEEEFKEILCNKILKLSEYEKRLIARIERGISHYRYFIEKKNIILSRMENERSLMEFKNTLSLDDEKYRDKLEEDRLKELHKRIFKDKMKLKKLHDYKAIWRILEDIVDFALIMHCYIKDLRLEIPESKVIELKYLFIKGIRLLNHDFECKGEETAPEDTGIGREDPRIEELSDYDFHLYMYRVGPWFFEESSGEPERLNVTGFIVHRLLELKYSFKLCINTPAEIPDYKTKVLLEGLNDILVQMRLTQYLARFNIAAVDVTSATNYFMQFYKEYSGIEDAKEEVKAGREGNASSDKKQGSQKDDSDKKKLKKNKKKSKAEKKPSEVMFFDKSVQFPSVIDVVTAEKERRAAELGRYAYETLENGETLSDAFVCYLIVEYIKTFSDIDGWVLIDFPLNWTQLAILEFMFSGLELPFMHNITENVRKLINSQMRGFKYKELDLGLIDENEEFSGEFVQDENLLYPIDYSLEELIKLRNSNILPKPNKPSLPPIFESYFTRTITLQKVPDKITKLKKPSLQKQPSVEIPNEGSTFDQFYTSLGKEFPFSYKKYDAETIEKLLLHVLDLPETKQNEISKVISVVRKNSVSAPIEFVRPALDSWVREKYQESSSQVSVAEEEMDEEVEMELEEIYPGHKDWVYSELPIKEEYQSPLATVWEVIEFFFTRNLKDCFALLRRLDSRVIPYMNYIRKKSKTCFEMEDDRDRMVSNFQIMLNQIQDHHRPVQRMKNELHYRVFELQCVLWKMSDVKKLYSQGVLKRMKGQKWIAKHLIDVLKVYNYILQIEADRFVDTLQLIEDYNSICLIGMPEERRLLKVFLPKIGWKLEGLSEKEETGEYEMSEFTDLSELEAQESNDSSTTKERDWSGDSEVTDEFDLTVDLYYIDFERDGKIEYNLFRMVETLVRRLKKKILEVKDICVDRCSTVTMKLREVIRKELDKGQVKTSTPKKSAKHTTKADLIEEIMEINYNKVFLEWRAAINDETDRMLYRTDLIKKRIEDQILDDAGLINETFEEFHLDIVTLYQEQLLNVDRICDLMRSAIEEEASIQPLIILTNRTLHVDASRIVFPTPPPPPPTPLEEISMDYKFTISQLTNFMHKMVYVAPFGIVTDSFVKILEDMACMGHETGHCYLPLIWSDLSTADIKDISRRLFGNKVIIDWRDFVIFALELPYPSLEQILETQHQFRILDPRFTELVDYAEYSSVFLWFEDFESRTISRDLYIAKAKDFLFNLFKVSENLMNYTAFLLAFCRDEDPNEGFLKALALAEGCATVASKQDMFRELQQIENENESISIAEDVYENVLNLVFATVENVIITEWPSEEAKREGNNAGLKSNDNIGIKDSASHLEDADMEDIEDHSSPFEILWKSDVYFSTVFSVFMISIHSFALDLDEINEPLDLERRLKDIFEQKGNGQSMKLYVLLTDPYIQNLLSYYKCFQKIRLSTLVKKLTANKDTSSKDIDEEFFKEQ